MSSERKPSYTTDKSDRDGASHTNGDIGTISSDYPMGRYKAWSTVIGSFLVTFCAGGAPSSFGVFQDFYSDQWLRSFFPSDISWIGSVQLFLELALAPLAGKLYDAGYFRHMIIIGSVILSFSFCMLSLAKQDQYYQVFLSQGIGMGLGIGLLYLPAATAASQHFGTRKALAMGIVSSSAPAGGVIYSIMLNQLIRGSAGFPWGVRYAAFMTIACLLVGNFLVFQPQPIRRDDDDDTTSTHLDRNETTTHDIKKSGIWDIPFVLVLICAFLFSFGTYFPLFYIQLYAVSHGIDPNLAFYSVALMNGSNVIGRILPNYLADTLGSMNLFIACLALNGAVTFAMLASGHPPGLILFTLIYGFSVGGTISLYLPMITSLSSDNGIDGRRMGISLAPVGLAFLIGTPVSGATLGKQMLWWRGVTLASVTMLFSSVCLIGIALLIRQRTRRVQPNAP